MFQCSLGFVQGGKLLVLRLTLTAVKGGGSAPEEASLDVVGFVPHVYIDKVPPRHRVCIAFFVFLFLTCPGQCGVTPSHGYCTRRLVNIYSCIILINFC